MDKKISEQIEKWHQLEEHQKIVDAILAVPENEDKIIKAMLKEDMLKLANKLAKKTDRAQYEKKECYIIDDEKVFLPITEKNFISSFEIVSMGIVFEDG